MKYLLLMYASESESPENTTELGQIWKSFRREIQAAGVLESSGGVPSLDATTTVRVREGKSIITDGPFAETHEQLGGYFVLDCNDLDEALRWAEKIPTAKYGAIEIRPLWAPD